MREARVGRNAPCPCGSGRKFKRCCSALQHPAPREDLLWQQCTRANDVLAAHLTQLLPKTLDPRLVAEANREFYLWEDPAHSMLASRDMNNVFYDWLFFRFVADPLERRPADLDPPLETVGEICRKRHSKRLSQIESRILSAALERGNSLVAVRDVERGLGLHVEDLLTGETFRLAEREGSKDTEPGMILFAHIAALPDLPHLLACSPVPLPAASERRIRDESMRLRRTHSAWTPAELATHDTEIRDLYFELIRESYGGSATA